MLFAEAWLQALRPRGASTSRLRLVGRRIFLPTTLRGCPRSTNAWVDLAYLVPPSVIAVGTWYRNINLLAIAYACRPRLRSRLTLSRLALLRNPWAFRRASFSLAFRYSCQHSRFPALHGKLALPLLRPGNAPLPLHAKREVRGFGSMLEPRYIVRARPLDQ